MSEQLDRKQLDVALDQLTAALAEVARLGEMVRGYATRIDTQEALIALTEEQLRLSRAEVGRLRAALEAIRDWDDIESLPGPRDEHLQHMAWRALKGGA